MPGRRAKTVARLPRVCWSVAVPTVEQLLARASASRPTAARFVEARLDYLSHPWEAPRAIQCLRRAKIPAIATLRSAAAGGNYSGSLEEQIRILQECARAGAVLVDLEIEAAERAGAKALAGLRGRHGLLLSFHDFRSSGDLAAIMGRLKQFKPDYYKVVTTTARHAENVALLQLNTKRPGRILAFAMGEIGMPTRVLSVAGGAPFTYAAMSAGEALAPGQATGEQLREMYRLGSLSRRTAVYGVIGNPIAHSLSPAVHNAAFAAARRDAVYLPFRVEQLDDFLEAVRGYRLAGFSVTIPHKEAVARAVDWADAEARQAGAVNTVVVRGGKLRGYNTDMAGIRVPLERRMRLAGKRVLVAGAGGAARAAALALTRLGARVFIVSRRPEQAAMLAEQVGGETVARDSLSAARFDAIIHATPLGMHPDTRSCFFSPEQLNAPLLFETVYNPLQTALVRMAKSRRMEVIPGLEMFLEQAAGQFELWTGQKAPRAVMEGAALGALNEAHP